MSVSAQQLIEMLNDGLASPSEDQSQILHAETKEVLANRIDIPGKEPFYQATGDIGFMKAGCKIGGCITWEIDKKNKINICLEYEWDCSGQEK